MTTIEEMRQYIRHPTNIPIEYSVPDISLKDRPQMRNVSRSGLSFITSACIEPGSVIHIKILLEGYDFEVDGIVMWCRVLENDTGDRYELGVKFSNTRAEFSVRMIEQLCYIEEYRQQVAVRENRMLTSDQATKEWLEKFADDFPS